MDSIMEVERSWLGERREELVGEVRARLRRSGRVERRERGSEVGAWWRSHLVRVRGKGRVLV